MKLSQPMSLNDQTFIRAVELGCRPVPMFLYADKTPYLCQCADREHGDGLGRIITLDSLVDYFVRSPQ